MSGFVKPSAFETAALQAVRYGRDLAERWPDVPVDGTASLRPLLSATLARLAAGDVYNKQDEHPLQLMLGAIRQSLDAVRPGYGQFFLREVTDEVPFFDAEAESIRRLGELLKAFLSARQFVIDTVLAERQIVILRKR